MLLKTKWVLNHLTSSIHSLNLEIFYCWNNNIIFIAEAKKIKIAKSFSILAQPTNLIRIYNYFQLCSIPHGVSGINLDQHDDTDMW